MAGNKSHPDESHRHLLALVGRPDGIAELRGVSLICVNQDVVGYLAIFFHQISWKAPKSSHRHCPETIKNTLVSQSHRHSHVALNSPNQ